jgi:hypothetical protein
MTFATDATLRNPGAATMARSKAQKRIAKKKRHAARLAAMMPATRTGRYAARTAGRPKEPREVGPTKETAAKLKPDTLAMLHAMRVDGEPFIGVDLVEAGHEILRVWKLKCPNGFPSGGPGGGYEKPTDKMEDTWRRWCGLRDGQVPPNELYRRCLVTPGKVVDWLRDSSTCDRDPKGAAGVLKRALEWWRLAARDAKKAGAAA